MSKKQPKFIIDGATRFDLGQGELGTPYSQLVVRNVKATTHNDKGLIVCNIL